MKKFLEPVIVILFIAGMTTVNLWHVIYHSFNRPFNTIYIGITHHYEDYFYYLSQLTQGARGAWEVRNLYTTEAIPPTLLWWINILLGKISGLSGIPTWTVYDVSLFLVTALSLLILYWAAKKLYPDNPHKRLAVFLVAALATCGYSYINNPEGVRTINPIVYFYNYTSSLNRLGGVVHLIVQNFLSLLIIFLFADILNIILSPKGKSRLNFLTVSVSFCFFLLAFINPVYVMVDTAAIMIVTIPLILFRFKFKRVVRLMTVGVITGMPLIIPVILLRQTFSIPFYQYFRWWESSILRAPGNSFFTSYGAIGILAALGIIPFLIKGNVLKVLGFVWAVLPVILYWSPLPQKLMIPYFRLTQPPQYIILAACAAEFIWLICNIFTRTLSKRVTRKGGFPIRLRLGFGGQAAFDSLPTNIPYKDVGREKGEPESVNTQLQVVPAIFWIMIFIFLAYQLPMIREEVRGRTENYTLLSWLNHLDRRLYDGLMVVKSLPHDKTVLAFNNLELIVPALTGQQTYAAHRSLTLEYPRKIAEVASFYTVKMTPDDAHKWLTSINAGYVLWKKADGDWTVFAAAYPFLNKYYENGSLLIFEIR